MQVCLEVKISREQYGSFRFPEAVEETDNVTTDWNGQAIFTLYPNTDVAKLKAKKTRVVKLQAVIDRRSPSVHRWHCPHPGSYDQEDWLPIKGIGSQGKGGHRMKYCLRYRYPGCNNRVSSGKCLTPYFATRSSFL